MAYGFYKEIKHKKIKELLTMNALILELLPYIKQGLCCSQLLMLLALQTRGETNSGLLRALAGQCHGLGQSNGPCGLLCGGATALAWLSSKDDASECGTPHKMLEPMVNEFATWFYQRVAELGSYNCEDIIQGLAKEAGQNAKNGTQPDMSLCADLLAECWEKILELYDSYDLGNLE